MTYPHSQPYLPPTLPEPPVKGRRLRRIIALIVTIVAIVALVLWLMRSCRSSEPQSVTVVAAGDMGCDPKDPYFAEGEGTRDRCRAMEVSDIAVGLNPYAMVGLGDYQYELPTAEGYRDVYGPTWGRLRDRTFPALGNQEYKVHEANTFRDFFGERAGPEQGYYSTQVGQWHVVVLNSNCTVVVGGCGEGSPQQTWLAEDLKNNRSRCVIAAWHHPRWSTGLAGQDSRTQALWQTLVDNGVDILLTAHEANYEQFPMLDGQGRPSDTGTRQFVVGTGGQVTYDPDVGDAPWRQKTITAQSDYRNDEYHGVLELQLDPTSYRWAFHALDKGVVNSGSQECH